MVKHGSMGVGRLRAYLGKRVHQAPRALAVAVVIALPIRWQVVEAFVVSNDGMTPMVDKGCHVVVNKLAYRFGDPQKGDLVVYKRLGKAIVAMVEAVEAGQDSLRVRDMASGASAQVARESIIGRVWLTTH